jgi:hypothetical protein
MMSLSLHTPIGPPNVQQSIDACDYGGAATLCFVCNQTINGRQAVPIGAVRLCREMSSPTEFSSSVRG